MQSTSFGCLDRSISTDSPPCGNHERETDRIVTEKGDMEDIDYFWFPLAFHKVYTYRNHN